VEQRAVLQPLAQPPQGWPDVELWRIAVCRPSSLDSPFKRRWKHSRHEAPASRSASFGVCESGVSRRRSERATEGVLEPRIRGSGRQIVSEAGGQMKRRRIRKSGRQPWYEASDRPKGAKKSDQVGVADGGLVKEFPARKP
jgi:hypothetical protein